MSRWTPALLLVAMAAAVSPAALADPRDKKPRAEDTPATQPAAARATASSPGEIAPPAPVIAIAAGDVQTCALLQDGTVWCFGNTTHTPARVPGVGQVVEIAAGGVRTCARLRDGTVVCWEAVPGEEWPRPVAGISGAVQITVGGEHACALLAKGETRCWGAKLAPGGRVAQIAAGGSRTCVRTRAGEVRCWDGDAEAGPAVATRASALAVGANETCVLEDGAAKCWGWNGYGAVGDGTHERRDAPVRVHLPTGVRLSKLALGFNIACGVSSTAELWCWGRRFDRVLHRDDDTMSVVPTDAEPVRVAGLDAVADVAVGDQHVCVRDLRGRMACWGDGVAGQLGAHTGGEGSLTPVVPRWPAGATCRGGELGLVLPEPQPGGPITFLDVERNGYAMSREAGATCVHLGARAERIERDEPRRFEMAADAEELQRIGVGGSTLLVHARPGGAGLTFGDNPCYGWDLGVDGGDPWSVDAPLAYCTPSPDLPCRDGFFRPAHPRPARDALCHGSEEDLRCVARANVRLPGGSTRPVTPRHCGFEELEGVLVAPGAGAQWILRRERDGTVRGRVAP